MSKKVWRLTFNGDASLEAKSKKDAQLKIQRLLDQIEELLSEAGLEVFLLESDLELFEYSRIGDVDDEDSTDSE
jgi:hypothetical protein